VVIILLDLLVWIYSSILSWILAPVGSLQIYILLIPDVLRDAAFGSGPEHFATLRMFLGSFLPDVLLGSGPELFATLRMLCNPSSGD
jgi:hypothetical protein